MMKAIRCFLSALLVVCILAGMIPMVFAAIPFHDVRSSDWHYSAVEYVYNNGLMTGTNAMTFSPNATTTRGMIVTILHRLEGPHHVSGAAFSDVNANAYYAEAVEWASCNNIVSGYGNGRFGPNDAITREQMATILYRYAGYCNIDTEQYVSISDYSDAYAVSDYAVDAMQWACWAGLLNGNNGYLNPQDPATRAEIATIMMRYSDFIEAQNERYDEDSENDEDEKDEHTVKFYDNIDNSKAYHKEKVKHGKRLSLPDDPIYEGMTFLGWSLDENDQEWFDISDKINNDLKLYAHWSVAATTPSTPPSIQTRPMWNPSGKTVPIMVPTTPDAMNVSFGQYNDDGNLIREHSGLLYNGSGYSITDFEYSNNTLSDKACYQGIIRIPDGYSHIYKTSYTYPTGQSLCVETDGVSSAFTLQYKNDTMIINAEDSSYSKQSPLDTQFINDLRPDHITQVLLNVSIQVSEYDVIGCIPGLYPVTYEYQFDTNGNLIQTLVNGITTYLFQYDNFGYMTGSRFYHYKESPVYKNVPRTDSSNNSMSDINGSSEYAKDCYLKYIYEYDGNGQMISCVCAKTENNTSTDYIYNFTYHDNGNLDKIILLDTLTYTVSYNKDHNISLLPEYDVVWD